MYLRLVTKKEEIASCQKRFRKRLMRLLTKKKICTIGFQGGNVQNEVYYNNDEKLIWYTNTLLTKKDGVSTERYWNAFGTEIKASCLSIVVEINISLSGNNKRVSGLFAKDELTNEYFLLHRGIIGGGKPGVGKKAFQNWYRGKWVKVVDERGKVEEAILISPISSNKLIRYLTEFIYEVKKFKDEVSKHINSRHIEGIEECISFKPEFYGLITGKRKSYFEYESNHGMIVNALEQWISKKLPPNYKTFNNKLIDLAVFNNKQTVRIYEVKTTSDTQAIYTGIGQLMFHSGGNNYIEKILVLPESKYTEPFLNILKRLNIQLVRYKIKKGEIQFIA